MHKVKTRELQRQIKENLCFYQYVQRVIENFFKKSRFIKQQEASGLLTNLEIRTSLKKIQLLGDILF